MTLIGAYEAKTRLPELLREIEKGQTFVITNRGRAVAVLGPVPVDEATDVEKSIAAMQAFITVRSQDNTQSASHPDQERS